MLLPFPACARHADEFLAEADPLSCLEWCPVALDPATASGTDLRRPAPDVD